MTQPLKYIPIVFSDDFVRRIKEMEHFVKMTSGYRAPINPMPAIYAEAARAEQRATIALRHAIEFLRRMGVKGRIP